MTAEDGSVLGATQIFGSAPRSRAFNVVMLADGFTSDQQNDFDSACTNFVNIFLATPPFDELAPVINVFRVNVTSTDSGADDPAFTGGTGATARTYFDSTFGTNGIRRLLTCNVSTALQVAAEQIPEFSTVLLVVNSPVYGGSGGVVGTYSLAFGATEIAIHEMGHSAFHLADEYPYYAGGSESGHDHHPAFEPFQLNVTINTDRATLKWNWAVAAATTVPTMSNSNCSTPDSSPSTVPVGTTGLFEGADYYHCGAYRPEYDCKMRNLGVPFCRVCRQVICDRIAPLAALTARDRTPIQVVARYPEHLDVFAIATDGRIMTNWMDVSSGWSGWSQVSGGFASPGGAGSPVTAVARYAYHLDLFTVGIDNQVYTCAWDRSAGWSNWLPIPGILCRPGSMVNVVSRYSDRLDLFTPASDGRVMSNGWDAETGWTGWFQVSDGEAADGAAVTAIARRPFCLDVFTIGADNRVYAVGWDERIGWSSWSPLGSQTCRPDSTVTVVARFPDQLDLFTTASDGSVITNQWYARAGWGMWSQVSNGIASPGSPVTAIARYSNLIDLFVIGSDEHIYTIRWTDRDGWGSWSIVSGGFGRPGGQVAAISRIAEHIDLFTTSLDGILYANEWDGSGEWAGWYQLGVV
jgi:hypothetical protein